ncbi:MAG: GAF domain-containing protein [Chthoniobacteraceae bacterium]
MQELEPTVDGGPLRKCVEEFAHLSRSDITAEQFFRKFISSLVPAIRARGMAVWLPQGQEFQVAGATAFEETDYANDPRQRAAIISAVREAATQRQPIVVPPGGPDDGRQPAGLPNYKPFAFLYVPIVSGEGSGETAMLGVLQLWLPTGFDPRAYKGAIAFIQSMAREAAVFLRAKRVETMAAGNARLQKMLLFASEMSGTYDVKRLGAVLVNWARDITGCDRCAFFTADLDGKLSPVAVSNVEVVNPKSALVRLQLKLAQEAMDAGGPTLFQKSSPTRSMQGDISDYFVLSHASEALAVPMIDTDKRKRGVLLAESHKERGLESETQNLVIGVANRATKAVAGALEIQQLPMLKFMLRAAEVRHKLTDTGPRKLAYKYGVPGLVIAAIALFPMRLMVRSDCMLIPKVRGVAVAEVGGRVTQVLVHEGDIVAAGEPIAKIDDEDLQENLRLSQEQQQQYQIEANRDEAGGDEAAQQIALVEVARAGRQVDLLKLEISRTWIKCPIGGVVLTKDIEMLAGSVIPAGTRFCDIGDFQRWQLVSKVAESEIGLVETKLRQGPLKMSFVLNSAPGREIQAVIPNEQAISPVSTAVPGANVFFVKADFDETPDLLSALKSGYSGRSKIPLDREPAIYLALRKFINYLRVRWFF